MSRQALALANTASAPDTDERCHEPHIAIAYVRDKTEIGAVVTAVVHYQEFRLLERLDASPDAGRYLLSWQPALPRAALAEPGPQVAVAALLDQAKSAGLLREVLLPATAARLMPTCGC